MLLSSGSSCPNSFVIIVRISCKIYEQEGREGSREAGTAAVIPSASLWSARIGLIHSLYLCL